MFTLTGGCLEACYLGHDPYDYVRVVFPESLGCFGGFWCSAIT